jgi:hypothetical protein
VSKLVYVCAITALFALASGGAVGELIWAKGQLHVHTTNSDGNGSPQQVADWYKSHGYQFLVITDHEKVTDPSGITTVDGFVLIPGEELALTGQGDKPIHANAINIPKTIPSPGGKKTQAESLQYLVSYIRDAGGIPMINHPNWCWAFAHREMLPLKGPYLLEVANMSSGCSNEGSLAIPSMEQQWDILLSNGREVYATATDDMHHINGKPDEEDSPGRGWVVARVKSLDPKAILAALAKGDFYASTGVELRDISFDGREMKVQVAPKQGQTTLIRFTGKWGEILREVVGESASCRISLPVEPNAYIRCKVIQSDGTVAWTQAFRIK